MRLYNVILSAVFLLLAVAAQAQTCNSAVPQSTPSADFELQNDGKEVLHKATGLIWKRCLQGQSYDGDTQSCTGSGSTFSWQEALQQADSIWRLPNIKELGSIVELSCHSPSINEAVFPGQPPSRIWTASAGFDDASKAWSVIFSYGFDFAASRSGNSRVRLVRGQ